MNLLDLSRPRDVLNGLAAEFPLLPAGEIDISPIYPNRLRLSFHDQLGDFEAWREALDIEPATICRSLQSGDTTLVLTAEIVRSGVTVELVAFSQNMALSLKAVAA